MDRPRQWRTAPDPLDGEATPSWEGVRREFAKVPLLRIIGTALFVVWAIAFARFSWTMPLSIEAERYLYDARVWLADFRHPAAQDERIVIVPYTQATIEATARRSPLDRAILARALAAIDGMGAKAIGIDMLIDQPLPEDEELLRVLGTMKTPVYLGYATNRYNGAASGGDVELWQQHYLDALIARLAGSQTRPASVRFEPDRDGVMRSWPWQPSDLPPLLPIAMLGKGRVPYAGSIDYRQPADRERPVFSSLPIDLFANADSAPVMREQVAGRYVFIGGDLPDVDQFDTPETRFTGTMTPGIEVHAAILAQTLDRHFPSRPASLNLWVLAILVVLAGAFTAMLDVRPWVAGLAIIGQFAFFFLAPFGFSWVGIDTFGLPAFGWLGGWTLAFAATGAAVRAVGSEQRRFAQSALGKYLPKDIAAQILQDPKKLSLTGEKRAIYTLFTDIEGFTRFSHSLPPERVATILNAYLDGMSDIVLDHGGTIDKFVGDAVVAFWGAPIAREDDADRAVEAMIAMTRFTRDFAPATMRANERFGRTRVGLHFGDAIVGNFGGEGRLTYTALGDAMNCAARLEGANKYLRTAALASEEVLDHAAAHRPLFRPMGRIAVSGRSTPLVVWEPAPEMDDADRAALAEAWRRFDGGQRAALHEIEAIAGRHPDDVALSTFACRLREVGPGGVFALREK